MILYIHIYILYYIILYIYIILYTYLVGPRTFSSSRLPKGAGLQIATYIYIYIYTSLIQRHSHLQNYQTLLRIETRPVTLFYSLPVSCIFRWFLHHFLWLLSHFPALSLYFSSIFTASWRFVPSIRSGFLHFPGDFVRFPLIVVMVSCSFIVFSNTSSWSLRPTKRRT